MTTPLSEHDLIQLNAYLDGELSARERAALERRLVQEPALRAELAALRETVALMKMARRLRVPRNFTLDPAVYGKPIRRSLWERLGLPEVSTAALAGAMLAALAVFAGVLIVGGTGAGRRAPSVAMEAAPVEQAAPEVAFEAESAAGPAEAAALAETEEALEELAIEEAAPAVEASAESGVGGGAPQAEEAVADSMAAEEEAAAPVAEAMVFPGATPTGARALEEGVAAVPATPEPTSVPESTERAAIAPEGGAAPAVQPGERPLPEGEGVGEAEAAPQAAEAAGQELQAPGPVRVLTVGLAVVAMLVAVLAAAGLVFKVLRWR